MKKYVVFIALFGLTVTAWALSPVEAFYTMPQELCPYFNYTQKKALVEQAVRFEETQDSAFLATAIPNLMGESSHSLGLSDGCLRLQIADGVEYDWLVQADTIYFVQTLCAPVCASVVTKYNSEWGLLQKVECPLPALFVEAKVKGGELIYQDNTPEILDEEERKTY